MASKLIPVKPVNLSEATRNLLEPHGLYIKNGVLLARNLCFRAPVYISENCIVMGSQIDSYSYLGRFSVAADTKIGRYCSIAHYVELAMGIHNIDRFSTTPALYNNMFFMKYSGNIPEQDPDYIERGVFNRSVIGNDVWIGANVKIPSSVTIGHGAVISTNAVITKDVPPYAVVVGGSDDNGRGSQRIIKYRFPDEIISDLMEINWWDYDIPRMIAQGIDVPRTDIRGLISFFKNEDRDRLIPMASPWRLLACTDNNTVHMFPTEPDTFMQYNVVEVDKKTGKAICMRLAV
ncbi:MULTISPECIES: CatB-related O-acetyltransferase [unclassified Anaerobiospirillum]|uniref:CatB-related O-acetyltransferase n=1 Tax=unclassified Anaerobiospirillum TaxID=2647410 RepID=UPI001FF5AEA4|nr:MULTISPECIES: CatB-related O-acetyltransferase [unclassified Anaerobiospirillum]MCK0534675.1 CatB-related O-acetyltransferase [Anaerobiospirillum sp. NML120511]MCK0539931.1 CatB-related O-acetyltransferase [Anaerobiospirillum sp. NML02-A-032]